MAQSVSVCIPTYKRPDVLQIAIHSCLDQSLLPAEILVGDDSPDRSTASIVAALSRTSPVPIRYFHHRPGLGQAANVHHLIQQAKGELISVLHDDDKFEPEALRRLAEPFADPTVAASYGKQFIISATGEYDTAESEVTNIGYFRTDSHAGAQASAVEAALIQQFPNDGYMIASDLAKSVGYLRAGEVGEDACDFIFGAMLADAAGDRRFFFVNAYTSAYRLSETSVSNRGSTNNAAYRTFKYSLGHGPTLLSRPNVSKHLKNTAHTAISQAVNLGLRRDGAKWYFSEWNRHRILTRGGLKLLVKLLMPRAGVSLFNPLA